MRNDESFALFFGLVNRFCELTGTDPPVLPRKRRAPQRIEVGSAEGSHSATVEDHYRRQYYEVLDIAISSVTGRFDQPGYRMYRNLECLLVSTANGEEFDQFFESITGLYKDDFDRSLLSAQLQNLRTCFTDSADGKSVCLGECVAFLCDLSLPQKTFFSEVCFLAQLIRVMPASNAVSERSFSAMRRLKSCLRSTMRQSRLNHLLLLNLNQEKVDQLDIDAIGDEFIRGSATSPPSVWEIHLNLPLPTYIYSYILLYCCRILRKWLLIYS